MLRSLDLIDGTGKPATQQIARFSGWTYLYIQVQGPGTVRLAATERELMSPAAGAGSPLNGLQVTALDGIVAFRWKGALWGIGSGVGTLADFQFPGEQE